MTYKYGRNFQWNTTDYDHYGRLIKKTSFTGKTVNISYDGLSVTVDDGTKIETTTRDPMGNVVKKAEAGAGEITYTYFGNGNLKSASYDGVTMTLEQDGWGRKTKLIDPSAGTYTYEYNGYGELVKETNPKGSVVYTYDEAGRMISKETDGDHTDMAITYNFNEITKQLDGIVLNDANGNSSQYEYNYDSFRRIREEKETTPYAEFTRTYTYNSFGKIATEENQAKSLLTAKSTTKKIRNTYQNGGLISISDFGTNAVLWELEALNARGQTLSITVGNGLVKTNSFDSMGFLTEIKSINESSGIPVELLRLEFDFDPQRGLLNSRHNSLFNWNESFGYDSLDRLTQFNDNNGTNSHTYDARGRITQNSQIGSYTYSGTSYQQLSLTLNSEGTAYYDSLDHQDISFNAFKKPVEIEEAGKDKISFDYNAFEGRSNMFYGGIEEDRTQRRFLKHYAANGSMEIKIDKDTGQTTFVIYIGGDAYSAPVIWHSEQAGSSTESNYYYLHRDYLGSILAITDADGVFKEKRHFDAWGNIVTLEDGNGNALSSFDILDRGYTGHEHLLSVGIIHMNGRLYDPVLHRFLSPDNYVQDPYNTQNFNRYGYVLNNPLKFTDPSGEFFWLAIGIGAAIGAITQALKPGANFGTIVGGALIGGLAGMVGAGVGNLVAGGTFFGSSVASTIGFGSGFASGFAGGFAGGFVGGAGNAWMNGANFGDGLMAGVNAGVIGGVSGGLINGISSGIRANQMGLDFWNGTGNFESPFDDSFVGMGDQIKFNNKSAKNFSDSHAELNRLSKNVDNLYADGSTPVGYSSKEGFLYNSKDQAINGVTNIKSNDVLGLRKTISVYMSKSAFRSTGQLYMSMHHEYMHAYFAVGGFNFGGQLQHRIINNWHFDQALQWRALGPMQSGLFNINYFNPAKAFFPPLNNYYGSFGFKIINHIP